jgi:phosphatidylethanolamine/phosphatidyl-N-methylethanolamine N-methyltransferase
MNENVLPNTDIESDEIDRETTATKARYNRIAPVYDLMEWFTERSAFQDWRRELWSRLPDGRILEVGVGTGKNMSFYPPGAQMTAIDLSEGMLSQARRRAQELDIDVDLRHMDVQRLAFSRDTFDAAVATFVFCSVPVPIKGLQEIARTVKPGGDVWLLEHVRINKPVVGPLMDLANPLVVRMMGANINRQTVQNVKRAGLTILSVDHLQGELVKLIHAQVNLKR